MPRYFFHIRDGAIIDDEIGSVFLNWQEAREEAFRRASRILRDHTHYQDGPPWQMIVIDQAGNAVLKIGFAHGREAAAASL